MKTFLPSLVLLFSFFATVSPSISLAATPPLSEMLTESNCKPQRANRKGAMQKFECINAKSDSLKMENVEGTQGVLTEQDEFAKFEAEATDLSTAEEPETEIE